MRANTLVTTLAVLAVAPFLLAGERTLDFRQPAAELGKVQVEAGVGDVQVAVTTEDQVIVQVRLKPRRGGFFSSMTEAEQEVERATLQNKVDGKTLHLEVDAGGDQRFEESWSLQLPARLALELEVGVGDVQVHGLAGGVRLESGVGDVLVEAVPGDLDLELGVGDATVKAPADGYGTARCSGGVGEVHLMARGERVEGDGFVGQSASWSGSGPNRLEVEVGVGDVEVTLE